LDNPSSVAVDAAGKSFHHDFYNIRVRKVAADGSSARYWSGVLGSQATVDRPSPRIYFADGVAADANDNLFLADQANYRIREVTSAGVVSTLVGNGQFTSRAMAAATSARSITGRRGGGCQRRSIYRGCTQRSIREVTGGVISTAAGSGEGTFPAMRPANEAICCFPTGDRRRIRQSVHRGYQ